MEFRIYYKMAFVFSEPRWAVYKSNQTPGPGHYPETSMNSVPKGQQSSKPKIRKGKTFIKNRVILQTRREQENYEQIKRQQQIGKRVAGVSKQQQNMKKNPFFVIKQFEVNKSKKNLGNIIQISSFQNGLNYAPNMIQNLGKYSEPQPSKQFEANDFEQIRIKKTQASIKAVSEQVFYVGCNKQGKQVKIKTLKTHGELKKDKVKKIRSSIKITGQNQDSLGVNPLLDGVQMPEKPTCRKPISAKHPFEKKNIYDSQIKNYEQKSTAIQDDQSEQSQFETDAVPGPGSYQIGTFTQSTKKCMMFTQKNKGRFSDNEKQIQCYSQLCYNQKPLTSQSKSRASQKKVGFGRSVINTFATPRNEPMESENLYYEDLGSIENRCLKNMVRDAFNPGSFTSKAPRFPQPSPKLSSQTFKLDLVKQNQIKKIKKILNDIKPTHPFSSAVQRKTPTITQIFDVDYKGQQYKTMNNQIKKLMSQPKYLFENIDEEQNQLQKQRQIFEKINANANVNSNKEFGQKRTKSDIEIKHQLIETMNGFRQREKKITRKREMKGFTFSNNQGDSVCKENMPDPGRYHRETEWVKNSFNLKFAQGYAQDTNKQNCQNEHLMLNCKSEAIKIIRM